jgi:hypothetical protein
VLQCQRCGSTIAGLRMSCQCGASLDNAIEVPDPPVEQERNKIILLGGLGAIVTGIAIMGSAQSSQALLGVLVVGLGTMSLLVSQCGAKWERLTIGQKAAVAPGVAAGIAVGIVAVVVIAAFLLLGWAVLKGLSES